jgi:hypothetical protein
VPPTINPVSEAAGGWGDKGILYDDYCDLCKKTADVDLSSGVCRKCWDKPDWSGVNPFNQTGVCTVCGKRRNDTAELGASHSRTCRACAANIDYD